jgi:hypothetical protein
MFSDCWDLGLRYSPKEPSAQIVLSHRSECRIATFRRTKLVGWLGQVAAFVCVPVGPLRVPVRKFVIGHSIRVLYTPMRPNLHPPRIAAAPQYVYRGRRGSA